jgi:AbrB family looped-hinge helix DNA binding protein
VSELVRVKDKFQVTLPVETREAASIKLGDYLEVLVVPEGILLRPRRLVPASRGRRAARTILDFLAESRSPGRSKTDIDRELKAERDRW